MRERGAYAVRAELALEPEADPAAVGAAVTVALCGHWEHDGACRWPHHNAIDTSEPVAHFRTVFVAPPDEANEVRDRIVNALCTADDWTVSAVADDATRSDEQELVARLELVGTEGESD